MWGFPLVHLAKPASLGDSNMLLLSHLSETGKERGSTKEYFWGESLFPNSFSLYIEPQEPHEF